MPNKHAFAINPIWELAAKYAQCKWTRKAGEESKDAD